MLCVKEDQSELSKKVTLAIMLLVLAGCSTTNTMNGIMASWEGSNIDEDLAQWSYPHEEREFQDRKLYIWHHNRSGYIPQTTNTTSYLYDNSVYATSTTSGGYAIQGSCQRVLEVDDFSTIVRWEWRSNNCPFGELMEYADWRKKEPVR